MYTGRSPVICVIQVIVHGLISSTLCNPSYWSSSLIPTTSFTKNTKDADHL